MSAAALTTRSDVEEIMESFKETIRQSVRNKASGIAEKTAHIDAVMGDLDDRIFFLKSTRNALSPIFRLPTEVLSCIFTEYALQPERALFTLKWTKVMLVCRRWHALAVSLQPLWSNINVYGPSELWRMDMQLYHSGVAPLTVMFALYSMKDKGMRRILEHSARIRHLQVGGEKNHMLAFVKDLPPYEFQILRSLSLIPDGKDVANPRPVFPEEMLLGGLPNLKKLTLRDFDVPFKSLRALESLKLRRCFDSDTSAPPSFASLLSVLESSPRLKTLEFELLLFDVADAAQEYRTVELPCLEFLKLFESLAQCCTDLLTHLVFPASTRLELHFGHSTGSELEGFLVPVRNHVRHRSAPPTPLLEIYATALDRPTPTVEGSLGISLWGQTAVSYGEGAAPPLRIYTHSVSEHALKQTMTKTLEALPREGITHLDATNAPFLTEASWAALVRLLPALEMVYIETQPGAEAVLAVLRSESERGDGGPAHQISSLHVCWTTWPVRESETIPRALEALEALLQFWHGRGTPLARLEIGESSMSVVSVSRVDEERWEGISRLVGAFILNGEEYDPAKRRAMPKVAHEGRFWRLLM
ncbi:hypothetical protein C8J57DRAFT_54964 [Mycena rebaudengoi]|nr:hypothetical protein C8J57DRAFT_54964 [Mycena rebaudengoi]